MPVKMEDGVIHAKEVRNATGDGPVKLFRQAAAKAFGRWYSATSSLGETLNVSSATDAGTGKVEFALTNPMISADFVVPVGGNRNSSHAWAASAMSNGVTTTGVSLYGTNAEASLVDFKELDFTIFGDLA